MGSLRQREALNAQRGVKKGESVGLVGSPGCSVQGEGGFWLTQAQAVSGELPLAGIIGQVLALLLQGHLARVHDDGQVACLDVCVGRLQEPANTKGEEVPSLPWVLTPR